MMKFKKILDAIVSNYVSILEAKLVGIYLHGSLAMGCATDKSDIDLLVVVNEPLSHNISRQLIDVILSAENVPAKGIEMSVVLKKYCTDFIYPTPFELHYSDFYRQKYITQSDFVCGGFEDEDLAAHFMVTKQRGVCLYGEKIEDVFVDVPESLYIKSIFYDITDAKDQIENDPVYHILNLCRTLAYVKDKKVRSKSEGGNWAVKNLEHKYIGLVLHAIEVYSSENKKFEFDLNFLEEFVDYMYNEIDKHI